MAQNYIPQLTNGLVPIGANGQGASLISAGVPNQASPAPAQPNANEKVTIADSVTVTAIADSNQIETENAPSSTQLIQPLPYQELSPLNFGVRETAPDGGYISYAGTNIQAIIEIGDNPNGNARFAKQLIELTTISISIHRAKSPASALGFIGAKGYARGRRTIAGTMVFTQFTKDVLFEFLNSSIVTDLSKDTSYVKVDQLPLFNMTLLFTSEFGYMSYRRLYGIDFVTDGTVYSTNDMMTEQTISYVASDFTPLTPLNTDNKYTSIRNNPIVSTEQTPLGVIAARKQV